MDFPSRKSNSLLLNIFPELASLGEITEIRRGFTTGANEFFYLDKEKVKLWGIEREYLEPVLTSPKDVKIEIRPEDVNEWILMVHEPKDALKKKNVNVLKYIEYGENVETKIRGGSRGGTTIRGYHNLSTVKSRKNWYDVGAREPAPILFSCKIWEHCRFPLNNANVLADKTFYEIHPKSKEDIIVLAGLLNSSMTALLSELHGRFYGGGVLELEVYEAKELPVLNPSKLSDDERMKIEEAFMKLCEAQRKGDSKLEGEVRQRLDKIIFDILGLTEDERKQACDGLDSLRQMRLQRKEVKVLVETEEGWKPPERHKAEEREVKAPSKRLDMWV